MKRTVQLPSGRSVNALGFGMWYLLHWPGHQTRKEEILEAFLDLKEDKKILDFGVSNFDTSDMKEWLKLPGASATAINQFFFNLTHRSAEKSLLPFCQEKGIPLIAYTPWVESEGIGKNKLVKKMAKDKGVTPRQLSAAWIFSFKNVGILTKVDTVESLEEVYNGYNTFLTDEEFSALSQEFAVVH